MSTLNGKTQQRGNVVTHVTHGTVHTDQETSAFPDRSFPRGNPEMYFIEPDDTGTHVERIATRSPAWVDDAECRDINVDVFFPGPGQRAREALEVCGRCPVRVECLAEAMADESLDHGVRGGCTSAARKQLRKTLALAAAQQNAAA